MKPEPGRVEEIEQMINVLKGCKQGREVQCRGKNGDHQWDTAHHPSFNFGDFHYRLKPEPRRFWLLMEPGGEKATICTSPKDMNLMEAEIIEVVEVIK